jgi:hypothetical protein
MRVRIAVRRSGIPLRHLKTVVYAVNRPRRGVRGSRPSSQALSDHQTHSEFARTDTRHRTTAAVMLA